MRPNNTLPRTKLWKSDQEEFIIYFTQPPEGIDNRKDKFEVQYHEVANSGIGINVDNDEQMGEIDFRGIVDDPHFG